MKKFLISLIVIALIIFAFFAIDLKRTKDNLSPMFALKITSIKDGGSAEFYGIGYKVIKYFNLRSFETKYEIGPWTMKFEYPFEETTEASFYGTITEVNDKSIIVEPLEGENIRNASDKISIPLADTSNAKVGGKVLIKYTGEVMESYPAQINLISVEYIYSYSLATKTIKTGIYKDNVTFPKKDIIKSKVELDAYLVEFDNELLKEYLKEYTDDYFKNKTLAIVAMQESSGSNVDSISEVITRPDKVLEVNIKRLVSKIGTADMAMWHFIIEVDKDSINDIDVKITEDKFYMYRNLGDFKGIELYTWKVGDTIYSGIMSGTNRNKTVEEINYVKENPATLEEMNEILKEYNRNHVFLLMSEGLNEEEVKIVKDTLEIR